MRQVTKAKMLEYYEARVLENILVLVDRIVAHKTGALPGDTEEYETVWCQYP